MATIIECFDKEPLDNIAAHYFFPEAPIIYFGFSEVMTGSLCDNITRFLKKRGCPYAPKFYTVDDYSPYNMLDGVIARMEEVLNKDNAYLVDCTGGTEVELIAIGRLVERHKMPIIRIEPEMGKCRSYYGDISSIKIPVAMALEDMVTLHGGCVVRTEDEIFPLNAHERELVCALWEQSKYAPGYFGKLSKVFNELAYGTHELHVSVRKCLEIHQLDKIRRMVSLGLIDNLHTSSEHTSFDYHNHLAKQLLTKTGLTMELFTRIAAEKSGAFHEVRQGVAIDWCETASDARNYSVTKNEVDVVMMRNLSSVWISCKSGDVKKEAFYELEVVAERFGGGYARKVLVCNNLSALGNAAESLRARAKDMGITVIENVNRMSLAEYANRLAEL